MLEESGIGGLFAGFVADKFIDNYVGDNNGVLMSSEAAMLASPQVIRQRTQIRKVFQSIALFGKSSGLYDHDYSRFSSAYPRYTHTLEQLLIFTFVLLIVVRVYLHRSSTLLLHPIK